MKVRAYLLLTAAAILVPVILFSTVALQLLRDAEWRAGLRSLEETARATALLVDSELSSAEAALRVLAASPRLAAGDLQRFYDHAKTADRGDGGRTILFAANGQQLINTILPFGSPLPKPPPAVQARTRRVIETQSTVVSGVIIGAVQRRPVTTINIPVPLDGGKRYVLGSVFDAGYFLRVIAQQALPDGWNVAVIDQNGAYVARSDGGTEAVGLAAAPALLGHEAASAAGQVQRINVDGTASYRAQASLSMAPWIVVVTAPVAVVEAAAQRATRLAAAGLFAAIALAAVVAVLFGGRLVRSIRRAAVSATALGQGERPTPGRSKIREVDELHAALQQAGDRLARTEAERNKLLHDEQAARKLAEQQNRAKDEFLAMLGHELRNPINAIIGAVELAELEQAGPERVARAQAIAKRQAGHLADIVDDLLDLTRLSKGKIKLERAPLDLAAAARAAVDALRATGRGDHIVTLDAEPAWVWADRTRVDQVINNLLTNAQKYTPDGGRIEVRVWTSNPKNGEAKDSQAKGGEAVLEVRDTGIGIAPELMPHLFDIFVQGSVSLDRSQGGLGIGLSLVRELVALHGGSVTAASDGVGQGSTFTVRLPLAEPAASDDPIPEWAPLEQAERCRVLLVEDNADARHTLAERLAVLGFSVLEAGDGHEGLRTAQQARPEVGIIDIGLPGLDGYALVQQLRAHPDTSDMALIALTGYGQQVDKERALAAGFDLHLVKPVGLAGLLGAIRQLRGPMLESAGT